MTLADKPTIGELKRREREQLAYLRPKAEEARARMDAEAEARRAAADPEFEAYLEERWARNEPQTYPDDPGPAPANPWAERDAAYARADAEYEQATAGDGADLERSLLGQLMRDGIPAPTMVHSWLYAGGLHTLQSEPGVGKSFVALWLVCHLLEAGEAVVYLDEEGGEELITERLVALGADPVVVDRLFFYYPFPARRWTDGDLEAFGRVVGAASAQGANGLGLCVLDSLPDFLAMAGLSEDSAADVTRFVHRLLGPVRDAGGALLVLDHLTKPDVSVSGDNKKRGRYARGSGAKLAKSHLTILLETERAFDRNTSGSLKVWKTKDRRGHANLPALEAAPLVLEVTVCDGRVSIAEGAPKAAEKPVDPWRPTWLMEQVSRVVEPLTETTPEMIAALVPGGRKTTRKQILGAVGYLIEDGYMTENGEGRVSSTRPYRQPLEEL